MSDNPETEAEPEARTAELSRALESERRARQASERALIEAVDSEQQRLAQLLHDTSSQSLNAARIYARVVRDSMKRTCPEASTTLLTLEDAIRSAADELQDLSRWLRPARLQGSDLSASLAELSQLASRAVPCAFRCRGAFVAADAPSQAELLRIAQLALLALVRPCRAKAITVALEPGERDLVLEIRAAAAQPLPSNVPALLGARARAAGGSFSARHEAAEVTLTCRLPLRA